MEIYLHPETNGKYRHYIIPEISETGFNVFPLTLIIVFREFDVLIAFEDVSDRQHNMKKSSWNELKADLNAFNATRIKFVSVYRLALP